MMENIVRKLVRIGKSLSHSCRREMEMYTELRNSKELNTWD